MDKKLAEALAALAMAADEVKRLATSNGEKVHAALANLVLSVLTSQDLGKHAPVDEWVSSRPLAN